MSEPPSRPLEVDHLVQRFRDEVAFRNRQGSCLFSGQPVSSPILSSSERICPPLFDDVARIESKSAYALADFLVYHDEDFVRNAYLGILGRDPDPTGFDGFLGKLRSGELSRVQLLGCLRFSTEGKARNIPVEGLRRPLIVQKIYRVPILGHLLAFGVFLLRLPRFGGIWERIETLSAQRDRKNEKRLRALAERFDQQLAGPRARSEGRLDQAFGMLNRKADVDRVSILEQAVSGKASLERIVALEQAVANGGGVGRVDGVDRAETLVEQLAAKTKSDMSELSRQIKDHKLNITDQHRSLALLLEEARKRLPEPISQSQIEKIVSEDDHLMDAMYVAFEDRLRGTRADIKQRVAVYLPVLIEARAGGPDSPIIDLGFGRGELLELLKENRLSATGIDLNRIMVSRCQDLGLDAIEADAMGYLRGLKPNSLGAVTGIHIIEHIPFKQLIALLDEVLRVLRPGGVAIFESPNPENLAVGACYFYHDPTHQRPLPPISVQYLLEARGFNRVEIMRQRPAYEGTWLTEIGSPQQIVNGHLFGPQDYALVAYKV